MAFNRQNPSPNYLRLLHQYKDMHTEKYFTGIGCFRYRKEIRKLVRETGATTLIDIGCGKGRQFSKNHQPKALLAKLGVFCESWMEALGVEKIVGYDPAVEAFAALPVGTFGGAYSCDTLEHIAEDDLPWILEEIFAYAEKFVFLTVATVPAKKNLPNGENAHVTLHSPEWWMTLIDNVAKEHPKVRYQVVFETGTEKEKLE